VYLQQEYSTERRKTRQNKTASVMRLKPSFCVVPLSSLVQLEQGLDAFREEIEAEEERL
jgi:hypothetical protein